MGSEPIAGVVVTVDEVMSTICRLAMTRSPILPGGRSKFNLKSSFGEVKLIS